MRKHLLWLRCVALPAGAFLQFLQGSGEEDGKIV